MPIWSASNSCSREKLAIDSRERASASSGAWGRSSTCAIDPGEERGGLREFGPLRRVARRDVGDLVRHHSGDLGRVVGERERPRVMKMSPEGRAKALTTGELSRVTR